MAKQSSVNLDITNNADGFSISGGTIGRTFGISGGDVTLVGSGAATITFPTTSTTIAGLGIAQTFTALQTFSAGITTTSITTGTTLGSGSSVMTFPSSTTTLAGLGIAQTFTALNQFNSGISATSGTTFNNATVYITNSTAVDPLFVQHSSTGALKVSTTGQARNGAIKLGNSTTATFNTYLNNLDGTLTFYNGISNTGSNMISFSSSAITIPTTISGATFGGKLNLNENNIEKSRLVDYSEIKTAPTISSGTLVLDLNSSNFFEVSLNANITTLTISNANSTANTVSGFTLLFTADGTVRAVTWPASVIWSGSIAPTMTGTNGKKDFYSFISPNNGTNWYGFVGGQNY